MWVFFLTKTLVNLPQHIYYRILKGNSKIMLLRAWGIISDLIAFSRDLGGGELTAVKILAAQKCHQVQTKQKEMNKGMQAYAEERNF